MTLFICSGAPKIYIVRYDGVCMVNFKPLKDYMFSLTDKIIAKHRLQGPFLDAGGGIGDVSLHLARKGFTGKLIDFSGEVIAVAKQNLASVRDAVAVEKKDILDERGRYRLILLWDVIEHAKNDQEIVNHCKSLLTDDGHLLVSFVTGSKEWRKDDEMYGHLRRYDQKDIEHLLKDFTIETQWDFTFPAFWAMRRIWAPFVQVQGDESPSERTKRSRLDKSFDNINKYLSAKWLWLPARLLCYPFKEGRRGHQCLVLAKKR